MKRIHAFAASAILALAAVLGVAATTKTAGIAAPKTTAANVFDQTIAARQRKLNRAEIALRKARNKKPPALPAAPVASSSPVRQQFVSQPAAPAIARSAPSHSSDDSGEGGGDD